MIRLFETKTERRNEAIRKVIAHIAEENPVITAVLWTNTRTQEQAVVGAEAVDIIADLTDEEQCLVILDVAERWNWLNHRLEEYIITGRSDYPLEGLSWKQAVIDSLSERLRLKH